MKFIYIISIAHFKESKLKQNTLANIYSSYLGISVQFTDEQKLNKVK